MRIQKRTPAHHGLRLASLASTTALLLCLAAGCDREAEPAPAQQPAANGEPLPVVYQLDGLASVIVLPSREQVDAILITDDTPSGGGGPIHAFHPRGIGSHAAPDVPTAVVRHMRNRVIQVDFGADGRFDVRTFNADATDELKGWEIRLGERWVEGEFVRELYGQFRSGSQTYTFDATSLSWRTP